MSETKFNTKIAIKSLKAYYESFIETIFSESFIRSMIENCSKEDVDYLKKMKFHKNKDCNIESMERFYRENFIINLIGKVTGDYNTPVNIVIDYLSKFENIDDVKKYKYLFDMKEEILQIKNTSELVIILDKGETTSKIKIKCDKEDMDIILPILKERYKDTGKVVVSYFTN